MSVVFSSSCFLEVRKELTLKLARHYILRYSNSSNSSVQKVSLTSEIPGILLGNLGGGVRPASGNPYPILDQNVPYPVSDLSQNLFRLL